MKILIVYEEVPETTTLFLMDFSAEEFERYKVLDHYYINSSDDEALAEVANELYGKLFFEEYPKPGPWADKKIDSAVGVAVEGVILTGFIL